MRLFFRSSTDFHVGLTSLYDLINPTAAAMWNLRWQVKGYIDERSSADNRELHGRFVAGSGIGSANLKRHCIESTWEEQLSEIALLEMFGAIGLFEGWVATLEVGCAEQRKRLQFPSRGIDGSQRLGVGDTIAELSARRSATLDAGYGTTLRSNQRYLPARIDDMLAIYRCFKEIRNACAHEARRPTPAVMTAFANASPRLSGLGRGGAALSLPNVSAGTRIELSLVNVQTLCALLLNIIATIDAELAVTASAESWFLKQWRTAYGFKRISGNLGSRATTIRRMSLDLGLPRPGPTSELYALLNTAGLLA